jgi:hypothetical protein
MDKMELEMLRAALRERRPKQDLENVGSDLANKGMRPTATMGAYHPHPEAATDNM